MYRSFYVQCLTCKMCALLNSVDAPFHTNSSQLSENIWQHSTVLPVNFNNNLLFHLLSKFAMDDTALRILSMLCEVSQTVKYFLDNQDCFEVSWYPRSRRQLALFLLLNERQIGDLLSVSYNSEQPSNRKITRRHFGPLQVPVTSLNTDDMTVKIYGTFMGRVLFNAKAGTPYENHGEKIYLSTHLDSDLKSLCWLRYSTIASAEASVASAPLCVDTRACFSACARLIPATTLR